MRNLGRGMDPGIGAPGGGDGVLAGLQLCQSRLDRALDRGQAPCLPLPARKRAAVIVDLKGVTGHGV